MPLLDSPNEPFLIQRRAIGLSCSYLKNIEHGEFWSEVCSLAIITLDQPRN